MFDHRLIHRSMANVSAGKRPQYLTATTLATTLAPATVDHRPTVVELYLHTALAATLAPATCAVDRHLLYVVVGRPHKPRRLARSKGQLLDDELLGMLHECVPLESVRGKEYSEAEPCPRM